MEPDRLNGSAGVFLCLGVDDFDELWLEGGAAHEETVNVLLGGELFAGAAGHRA